MKVIKPLRLGVLSRPWRWQCQNRLGVAVLALTDMSAAPRIYPEPELWQLAASELSGNAALLDMAFPKACAEFLATGYAHTRHQAGKEACVVSIRVGELEKRLLVSGERFWCDGRPSPPRPFDQLKLDWEHAYGGADVPENPLGIGAAPVMRDGVRCHPLPRIEHPDHLLGPARRATVPAGFGPLDFTWPRQFGRIGKQYDRQWLERDFPGFAQDVDWHLFNRAERDQWWPRQPALPPGARWRITNMHPAQPVQQGVLPPWRARCFITRAGQPAEPLEEIELRATTLWFFPHLERMLLVWHGNCVIGQDDAADVAQLTAAMESVHEPRPLNHYPEVIRQRLNKETGAAHALRDQDLMTAGLMAPWLDTEPGHPPGPLSRNLSRRADEARAQWRAGANETDDGPEPEPAMPSLRALDQLPEYMAAISRQAEALQLQARQKAAAMSAGESLQPDEQQFQAQQKSTAASAGESPRSDEQQFQAQQKPAAEIIAHAHPDSGTAAGPAGYLRMSQLLADNEAQAENAQNDETPATSGSGPTDNTQRSLHWLYRHSADSRPPAAALDRAQSRVLRHQVQARLAAGGDCRGMDLTGADLGGLDLRGGDFRQALLESATLDNCLLDHADLRESMLAHASLQHTSLCHALLDGASLSGIRCRHSRFTAARLRDVLLQQAVINECDFDQSVFEGVLFHRLRMDRCRFQQTDITRCIFMELEPQQLDFSHCRLSQTTFLRGGLPEGSLRGAQLTDCAFIGMDLTAVCFQDGRLEDCVFTDGSRLSQGNFRQARLNNINFRQMALAGSDFRGAQANGCDFSEASLAGARLSGMDARGCLFIRTDLTAARLELANLSGALLQKSRLAGAILRGANVFRADLSQAVTDKHTRLQEAYLHQCKTLPAAEGSS